MIPRIIFANKMAVVFYSVISFSIRDNRGFVNSLLQRKLRYLGPIWFQVM